MCETSKPEEMASHLFKLIASQVNTALLHVLKIARAITSDGAYDSIITSHLAMRRARALLVSAISRIRLFNGPYTVVCRRLKAVY